MTAQQSILAIAPQPRAEAWWQQRHLQKKQQAQAQADAIDIVLIGDSITHFWEDKGLAAFNRHFDADTVLNLGFSGDCTEHVLWRLMDGALDELRPSLIVLLIGTNNAGHRRDKPQHIAQGVKAIIDFLQQQLPNSQLLLLAMFPRSKKSTAPMRHLVNDANLLLEDLAAEQGLHWLDLQECFLDNNKVLSESIMPDFLHLNADSYHLWAEAMMPQIRKLLA